MKIFNKDSLQFLKEFDDYSIDINYSDPPYALGSEIIIREDGKVDYEKAVDFMNRWQMPTGSYWKEWFKESYRTLKYGGYCIMFGMDRQLLLHKYYAKLAGFQEQQSLYWYYINNLPKATDLSKQIDKNAGAERDFISKSPFKASEEAELKSKGTTQSGRTTHPDITAPSTEFAKKYNGYKYSISPLKQTNETIMVFQKPYKTGSCLYDVLAYENGDEEVCCGALNIDGNRVGTDKVAGGTMPDLKDVGRMSKESIGMQALSFGQNIEPAKRKEYAERIGRYPAQTFLTETAEIIDKQSEIQNNVSRISHTCNYERGEHNLYFYNPKVNKNERNAGCEELKNKKFRSLREGKTNDVLDRFISKTPVKNNHPTLKPISLNEKILRLFKTPNPQKIIYPFAGTGSEIIGGIKAGFTDWSGCEINKDYIKIANARIKHWTTSQQKKLL